VRDRLGIDDSETGCAQEDHQGCKGLWLERVKANHTVFNLDGLMIPIARHNEIDNQMAEIIYKECADKLGKDWWRR
jgi:hypothetical protein